MADSCRSMGLRVSGSRRCEILVSLLWFVSSWVGPDLMVPFLCKLCDTGEDLPSLLHVTSFAADIRLSAATSVCGFPSIGRRIFFLLSLESDEHCYVAPVLFIHEDSTDSLIPSLCSLVQQYLVGSCFLFYSSSLPLSLSWLLPDEDYTYRPVLILDEL